MQLELKLGPFAFASWLVGWSRLGARSFPLLLGQGCDTHGRSRIE